MNGVECAAKQSYFSYCHKKLTTKLCVVEKILQKKLKYFNQ
jgi:hypothetical protein